MTTKLNDSGHTPKERITAPFIEKVIEFHFEKLKDRSYQHAEKLKEQLEDLVSLFIKKSEKARRRKNLSDELTKQFKGGKGFFDFVSELMKKSYGYQFSYNFKRDANNKKLKEKEFAGVNVPLPHLPAKLNTFDLLRLAEQYKAPKIKFRPETVVVLEEGNNKVNLDLTLQANFEEQALSIIFNSVFEETRVCTKNKRPHSLAAYQDAADLFTHRLRVTSELTKKKGESEKERETISSSLLETTIIECSKKSLLIEGVYGKVGEREKEKVFDYLYACLIKYAYETKNDLAFNLGFNPRSQQEPIEFVNYITKKILKKEFYTYDGGKKRFRLPKERKKEREKKYKQRIRATTLKDKSKKVKKIRKNLEKKLKNTFKNPKKTLDDLCEEGRYADSWWHYFKSEKEKVPEWNTREGECYCLRLGYGEVKKEYERLFGRKKVSGKKKFLFGLVGLLLGGLLTYGGYYYLDVTKEHPSKILKHLTKKEVINETDKLIKSLCYIKESSLFNDEIFGGEKNNGVIEGRLVCATEFKELSYEHSLKEKEGKCPPSYMTFGLRDQFDGVLYDDILAVKTRPQNGVPTLEVTAQKKHNYNFLNTSHQLFSFTQLSPKKLFPSLGLNERRILKTHQDFSFDDIKSYVLTRNCPKDFTLKLTNTKDKEVTLLLDEGEALSFKRWAEILSAYDFFVVKNKGNRPCSLRDNTIIVWELEGPVKSYFITGNKSIPVTERRKLIHDLEKLIRTYIYLKQKE